MFLRSSKFYATVTAVSLTNCLIYLGKISPLSPSSNPRWWLVGGATMIIYDDVIEEERVSLESHGAT